MATGSPGTELGFSVEMFRDHDVVVSLSGMTAVLLDPSLYSVERLVAAASTADRHRTT